MKIKSWRMKRDILLLSTVLWYRVDMVSCTIFLVSILFEIAYLTEEKVKMFKSDFGIVADYFVQMQKKGDYKLC